MTTAILSALAEEQQGLLELLQGPQRVQRAGREFWLGQLHGTPVVLALSRIGKVAAATTTTTLVEAFGAQRLVFTGVAGGIAPGVRVGDVVVAQEFVQHDMDASPLFPRYQIPLYGRERFACDADLSQALLAATRMGLARLGLPAAVHHGLIASGDRFVSAAEEARALHVSLTEAGHPPLAVEMEGAAVPRSATTTPSPSPPYVPSPTAPTTPPTWTSRNSSPTSPAATRWPSSTSSCAV